MVKHRTHTFTSLFRHYDTCESLVVPQVTKLEEDLNVVRDAGGMGMLFQTLALPEGMAVSSADVIASLNEHLVQALHVSIDLYY